MKKVKIVSAIATIAALICGSIGMVYAADATTAYSDLTVTDKHYYSYYSNDMGVYPVIQGMDKVNESIAKDVHDKYVDRIYTRTSVGSATTGQGVFVGYKVNNANRYADITITYNFVDAPFLVSKVFYIDKETKSEITAEAHAAGIKAAAEAAAAATTATEEVSADISGSTASPAASFEFVMVPLRANAEKLGYTVTWEATTKTATVSKDDKKFDVTDGKNQYLIDNTVTTLDNAPSLRYGTLYVPVSFFQKALGATASIDKDGNVVIS